MLIVTPQWLAESDIYYSGYKLQRERTSISALEPISAQMAICGWVGTTRGRHLPRQLVGPAAQAEQICITWASTSVGTKVIEPNPVTGCGVVGRNTDTRCSLSLTP